MKTLVLLRIRAILAEIRDELVNRADPMACSKACSEALAESAAKIETLEAENQRLIEDGLKMVETLAYWQKWYRNALEEHKTIREERDRQAARATKAEQVLIDREAQLAAWREAAGRG